MLHIINNTMTTAVKFFYSIAKRVPIIGKHITEEFIRFLIIGTTAFIINFLVYRLTLAVIKSLFSTDDKILHAIMIGGPFLFAYFIAYLFNFTMSKKWTFKNQSARTKTQAIQFLSVNTFNAIAGSGFIALLDYFGVSSLISQPLFVACESVWSFLLYKLWVFRDK